MDDPLDTCPTCHGPLIEIDHYGERFIGFIECNRWGWPDGDHLFMELPEEDIEALRARVTRLSAATTLATVGEVAHQQKTPRRPHRRRPMPPGAPLGWRSEVTQHSRQELAQRR